MQQWRFLKPELPQFVMPAFAGMTTKKYGPTGAWHDARLCARARAGRQSRPLNFLVCTVMAAQFSEFVSEHAALALAFAGVTVALLYTELSRLTRGYKAITPAQLTALINHENALVIDIRASAEFEKGHIVGAKNLTPSQFDPENKVLAKVKELPVVLVCRTGITVSAPAKRLLKAGFSRVHVLDGGIAAWQQAELPLTRGK